MGCKNWGKTAGQEEAEVAQLIIEYDPEPPIQAGCPRKASGVVRNKAKAERARLSQNARNDMSALTIRWRTKTDRSDLPGIPSCTAP